MDTQSILDKKLAQAPPGMVAPSPAPLSPVPPRPVRSNPASKSGAAAAPARARETLRFPGEDGGKSLSEMAQRDLDATLLLLAERAQYITGATGSGDRIARGRKHGLLRQRRSVGAGAGRSPAD